VFVEKLEYNRKTGRTDRIAETVGISILSNKKNLTSEKILDRIEKALK
jgi:hypothetical protein